MSFETTTLREYSDDAILSEIRRVAEELGGKPRLSIREFDKRSKVASTTVRKRFGSWRRGLARAGLEVGVSPNALQISADEIAALVKEIASKTGVSSLTQLEFTSRTGIGQKAILNRFSAWRDVLAAAGLEPTALGRRYSDDDCFENVLRLWTHYGRQPTFAELNRPPSNVGSKAYKRRWGGWRNALHAFVEQVNKAPEPVAQTHDPAEAVTTCQSGRTELDVPRSITLAVRYKVLSRDRFRCVLCGRSPAKDPSIELHVDHILAWSRGGTNVLENLRTTCSARNLGKGDKLETNSPTPLVA